MIVFWMCICTVCVCAWACIHRWGNPNVQKPLNYNFLYIMHFIYLLNHIYHLIQESVLIGASLWRKQFECSIMTTWINLLYVKRFELWIIITIHTGYNIWIFWGIFGIYYNTKCCYFVGKVLTKQNFELLQNFEYMSLTNGARCKKIWLNWMHGHIL